MLAWCRSVDGGVLAGTRDALYLDADGDVTRIPWEQVEAADWDRRRPTCCASRWSARGASSASSTPSRSPSPAGCSSWCASASRRASCCSATSRSAGRRGVRVIGRRPPRGNAPIEWFYEYDEGVDPADPAVRTAAAEALVAARGDVGLSLISQRRDRAC